MQNTNVCKKNFFLNKFSMLELLGFHEKNVKVEQSSCLLHIVHYYGTLVTVSGTILLLMLTTVSAVFRHP